MKFSRNFIEVFKRLKHEVLIFFLKFLYLNKKFSMIYDYTTIE
jgi:hypothetical protein